MRNWKSEFTSLLSQTISDLTFKDNIGYRDVAHLYDFIETLLAEEREKVVEDVIRFVEEESGKSGRKEILGFLRGCLTSSKDKE